MTLLLTFIAAIITTLIWYTNETARNLKIGILCYMYWGASLMWMCDAVAEYLELRAEYFQPYAQDMLNDAFLGVSVIVFALVIWLVVMIVKDPMGTVKKSFRKS